MSGVLLMWGVAIFVGTLFGAAWMLSSAMIEPLPGNRKQSPSWGFVYDYRRPAIIAALLIFATDLSIAGAFIDQFVFRH